MQRTMTTTLIVSLACAAAVHFAVGPATAQSSDRIAGGLTWRYIGRPSPAAASATSRSCPAPSAHLRRGRVGRGLGDRQPRHHLDAIFDDQPNLSVGDNRARPVGSARDLGGHRRGQQPQQLAVGAGRVPLVGRRQDVGGSPGSRTRGTWAASWCIPRTRIASGWRRWAISSARTRSAASSARPTGAPHGRRSSTSTRTPVRSTSPWTRPTPRSSMRPCTSASGGRTGSSGADPAAASTRARTAATAGAS